MSCIFLHSAYGVDENPDCDRLAAVDLSTLGPPHEPKAGAVAPELVIANYFIPDEDLLSSLDGFLEEEEGFLKEAEAKLEVEDEADLFYVRVLDLEEGLVRSLHREMQYKSDFESPLVLDQHRALLAPEIGRFAKKLKQAESAAVSERKKIAIELIALARKIHKLYSDPELLKEFRSWFSLEQAFQFALDSLKKTINLDSLNIQFKSELKKKDLFRGDRFAFASMFCALLEFQLRSRGSGFSFGKRNIIVSLRLENDHFIFESIDDGLAENMLPLEQTPLQSLLQFVDYYDKTFIFPSIKTILERHGGKISLEQVYTVGQRIRITLPHTFLDAHLGSPLVIPK